MVKIQQGRVQPDRFGGKWRARLKNFAACQIGKASFSLEFFQAIEVSIDFPR
jgi:hypothetical protein